MPCKYTRLMKGKTHNKCVSIVFNLPGKREENVVIISNFLKTCLNFVYESKAKFLFSPAGVATIWVDLTLRNVVGAGSPPTHPYLYCTFIISFQTYEQPLKLSSFDI